MADRGPITKSKVHHVSIDSIFLPSFLVLTQNEQLQTV